MTDIEDAVRAGERNRDTMVLVRNWCGNARLKKAGGTGMVEQMTGLPVGHHLIECDYAPGGGFASWDLRDSAIDFYDRNSVGCARRKAIGLPNLTELVAERDKARTARDAEIVAAEKAAAAALAARVGGCLTRSGILRSFAALPPVYPCGSWQQCTTRARQ